MHEINPTGLENIHAGESVKVKYLSKNVHVKLCIWPTRTQDKCDTNSLWLRVNELRNKKQVAPSYLNSQELSRLPITAQAANKLKYKHFYITAAATVRGRLYTGRSIEPII